MGKHSAENSVKTATRDAQRQQSQDTAKQEDRHQALQDVNRRI